MKSMKRADRRWKTFRKLTSRRKSLLHSRPNWQDWSDINNPKPWKPDEFEVKNPTCFSPKTAMEKAWEDPTRKRRMRLEEQKEIEQYDKDVQFQQFIDDLEK